MKPIKGALVPIVSIMAESIMTIMISRILAERVLFGSCLKALYSDRGKIQQSRAPISLGELNQPLEPSPQVL